MSEYGIVVGTTRLSILLRSRWTGEAPVWGSDIDGLIDQARRHRVAGLLAGVAGAPPEVTAAARPGRHAALRHWILLRRLLARFEQDAIRVLVLKGPALSSEAHGHFADRDARDLDLLVAPADMPRARHALHRAGLRAGAARGERIAKDASFYAPEGEVELHWRLFGNPHLMKADPAWLARPRLLEVDGVPVPVLPERAGMLYLLVHGSSHRWERLKWAADVAALLATRPGLVVPEQATRLGVQRCVAEGLLVCERMFGGVPGSELGWAEGAAHGARLAGASLAALAGPEPDQGSIGARTLLQRDLRRLSLRTDARYRVTEIRALLEELAGLPTTEDHGPLALLRGLTRRLG